MGRFLEDVEAPAGKQKPAGAFDGLGFIAEALREIKRSDLYRSLVTVEGPAGAHISIGGKSLVNFASNDYLGLAKDARLKGAAKRAVEEYGTSASASRLMSGNLLCHERLEEELARFKRSERALVFPTGFMAVLGTVSALAGAGDLILFDRLCHASIIDAVRLSGAKFRSFPHSSLSHLKTFLSRSRDFRRKFIITEGVFSMDGDLSPLAEMARLARDSGAILIVDDAHGTGVLGASGRGTAEHFHCEGKIDVLVGTLSKALGSQGGFVTGSCQLIRYLRNKARSFIYTTALAPPAVAAATAALKLIHEDSGPREHLWKNIRYLKQGLTEVGLSTGDSQSAIIPIIIGEANDALAASRVLFEAGIFVPAIRPPTVPRGKSRLRISLSAAHRKEDLERLVSALGKIVYQQPQITQINAHNKKVYQIARQPHSQVQWLNG